MSSRLRVKIVAFNLDAHAGDVAVDVKLFDLHPDRPDPRIGEAKLRDPLRQGFDQAYMAGPDDPAHGGNDLIIADHVAQIVVDRIARFTDQQVEIDADALRAVMLVSMDS